MDSIIQAIMIFAPIGIGYFVARYLLGLDVPTITYSQAAEMLNEKGRAVLLDVRTHEEFKVKRAKGAINIPLHQLGRRLGELGKYKDQTVIVLCASGRRSQIAVRRLLKAGFPKAKNFNGGMAQWQGEIKKS